jgi:hypothetical protein
VTVGDMEPDVEAAQPKGFMATTVSTIRDIALAATSGKLADLFPTIDRWLPALIATVPLSV